MNYVFLYLGTLVTFFIVDSIWLGLVAKNLYRDNLKHLLAEDFNKLAAGVFYTLFITGILIFAVLPALKDGDLAKAASLGALFGFFTYATYDLTNLATLKDWPLSITLIDLVWGSFLTGVVASAGFLIGTRLGF